ncbi:MAG: CsgG/HfaB family protein [Spirochaetaceae bacterium]|jgi:TolB-like protein|nr:CsgG/HfaB family protein [Spirochaetaceae bacterium]
MKFLKKSVWVPIFSLFVFGLISCATKIDVKVTRPPAFDTSGVKRIAVMPFDVSSGSGEYSLTRSIAGELTMLAGEIVLETGRFTLIASEEVKRLERSGENIANYVDAYINGTVNDVSVKDDSSRHTYTDAKGKTTTSYTYTRRVNLDFTYRLVNARDGSIIGQRTQSQSSSSQSSERSNLESASGLARDLAQSQIRGMSRDIAPWVSLEKRTLAEETSKDKNTKTQMKEAESLVEEGSYKAAFTRYDKIYDDTGSFAAGYNAAIMAEALGNLEGAISAMQRVYDDTGNSVALADLSRMRKDLADANTVKTKHSDNDGSIERIIKQASVNIAGNLPRNSRLSLLNISTTEKQFSDYVIDNIMTELVNSAKLTVIDRQNSTLLSAERNFQASGLVSDETAVSIGHELGVDTIVLCSVAGASNLRRLMIRALNVETGKIIYQTMLDI